MTDEAGVPMVKTKEALAKELEIGEASTIEKLAEENPALAKQADDVVSRILAIDPKNTEEQQRQADAVRNLGSPVQAELAKQSQMLKAPMQSLMKDAEDGGQVANGLLSLQEQVNKINPNRADFTMSTLRRLISKLPGVGTPMARWFAKYQSVSGVIEDVVNSLKDGKAQLLRDNTTLRDDQSRMRSLTIKLQEFIKLGQLMDRRFSERAAKMEQMDERRKFIEEEILFPLRQRIVDLQQQMAVNQQGVLATEVIVRNNLELITGVNRALNVTITALNTAATLQVALQRQKRVLEGVEAVTDTTNDLIAGTAEQLKTQGTQIQKRAAQTQLDISKLQQAFRDVETALNDISEFRRQALPAMAHSIVEMDELTHSMEGAIQKMEGGNAVNESAVIGLEILDEK